MTGNAEEEVIEVLYAIQRFDPMRVAARDLRECQLIQVNSQGMEGTLAEKILLNQMDMLENREYDQKARSMSFLLHDVENDCNSQEIFFHNDLFPLKKIRN